MIFTGGPGLKIARLIYHMPNFARLFRALWKDPRVPIYHKAAAVLAGFVSMVLAAAYFVWKMDADFVPFVGKLDDILVAAGLVILLPGWVFLRIAPKEILAEHVAEIASKRRGSK